MLKLNVDYITTDHPVEAAELKQQFSKVLFLDYLYWDSHYLQMQKTM